MKKVFVEPEMQRIELNLQENIAVSAQAGLGYYFWVDIFSCHIMDTGKTIHNVTAEEAASCLIMANSRSVMMFYPREEVIPHFRH